MGAVELRGVNFTYGAKTPYEIHALTDVNLTIQDKIMTGLIGHTGSGKSTLVQLLNGLLKPESGQVLLDGKDIWEEPKKIRDIRFKVGLVMQYPEYQLFDETVRADISFGPKNMGLSDAEVSKRVTMAADFVGLAQSQLDKSPFDLSGGQRRRAALAGVIAMSPEVLVLDEPAAGLDPGGRREILTKIKNYQRESGTSVIIVSHSMEDMAIYCDRVVVMHSSKIMLEGTCAEVFSRYADLLAAGLDVPQITRVAAALKERGIDIGDDIYTVKYAIGKIAEMAGIDINDTEGRIYRGS
jgi:ABC-type cobalt transport system, ATPase component